MCAATTEEGSKNIIANHMRRKHWNKRTGATHVTQGQVFLLDAVDAHPIPEQPAHGVVVGEMHRQRARVSDRQAGVSRSERFMVWGNDDTCFNYLYRS